MRARMILRMVFLALAITISLWMVWVYYYFHGGTPWGRHDANQMMERFIRTEYPDGQFSVVDPTRYSISSDAFTIDVVFTQNTAELYTFALPSSTHQVRLFRRVSYNDMFSSQYMEELRKIVDTWPTTDLGYTAYVPTGGIGTSTPELLSLGPPVTIVIKNPSNGCTYEILELPKEAKTQDPESWVKRKTASGNVYMADAEHPNQFYKFQNGDTLLLVDSFPQGPFPDGLITHLVPIHH